MSPRILTLAAIALVAVLASMAAIAVAPDRQNPVQKSIIPGHRAALSALR
jgi:hypothetical protein